MIGRAKARFFSGFFSGFFTHVYGPFHSSARHVRGEVERERLDVER
jgi:hypothetical protein